MNTDPIADLLPQPTGEHHRAPFALMREIGSKAAILAGVTLVAATAALTPASGLERAHGQLLYPTAQASVMATLGEVATIGDPTQGSCSALVLERVNPDGTTEAVADLTAAHCVSINPRESDARMHKSPILQQWQKGADGNTYVVEIPGWQTVEVGDASNKLRTVGTVDEIVVSTKGDNDQALEVLKGHSLQEALDVYQQYLATPEQIAQLKPGDNVYLSGWPGKQNGDGKGNMLRQDFETQFVAQGQVTLSTGEKMDVVWLACPLNSDGATCFHGLSGGVANITIEADGGYKQVLLGTVYGPAYTAYDGLNPNDPNAHPIARQYPSAVDWSQFADVTAIAIKPLTSGDTTVLHLVTDESQIPKNQSGMPADTKTRLNVQANLKGTTTHTPTSTVAA